MKMKEFEKINHKALKLQEMSLNWNKFSIFPKSIKIDISIRK